MTILNNNNKKKNKIMATKSIKKEATTVKKEEEAESVAPFSSTINPTKRATNTINTTTTTTATTFVAPPKQYHKGHIATAGQKKTRHPKEYKSEEHHPRFEQDEEYANQLVQERKSNNLKEYSTSDILNIVKEFRHRFPNEKYLEQVYRIYGSNPFYKGNRVGKMRNRFTSQKVSGLGFYSEGTLKPQHYLYNLLLINDDLSLFLKEMLNIDNALGQLRLLPLPVYDVDNIDNQAIIKSYVELFESKIRDIRANIDELKNDRLSKGFQDLNSCIASKDNSFAQIIFCLADFSKLYQQEVKDEKKDSLMNTMIYFTALAIQQAINYGGVGLIHQYATDLSNTLK